MYTTKERLHNHITDYGLWLQKYLLYCSYKYYYDTPIISDAEYDRLYAELENIEKMRPEIVTPDSITQIVAPDPSKPIENPGNFEDFKIKRN